MCSIERPVTISTMFHVPARHGGAATRRTGAWVSMFPRVPFSYLEEGVDQRALPSLYSQAPYGSRLVGKEAD
ncbi:hypothetical protein Trco_004919 [Trichoderma cornu-damae]|uniref:Uncharacterized protein n=1 Tax=Trichoderma cornu-damae TaxID=654480 RepID=A0A9P8TSB1_9HYPO|nr:hypothetical protein Trco_004919 [Trichoderma cornu-damae]